MASASDNATGAEDVVIARIVKPRGIKGELACDIETDFPERFDSLEQVTVLMPGGARQRLTVEDHWFHKNRVVLKFEGYDTMTAAEQLVGGLLVIAESEAMPLEEDEFYEYRIVGADVVTISGQPLGKVSSLLRTGATDVLVVKGEQGKEHLIPFADNICTEVDVEAGRITVDPPEGLLDL